MRGYIFDLDGTVYLGNRPIEGAAEAIRRLRERGDRVVFLSNKPIASRASYVDKLTKMGIPVGLDEVIHSSLVTARYLRREMKPGERVLVIGEQPLLDELRTHGVPITDDPAEAQYVLLSWDRQFTYDKLHRAFKARMRGAKVIATNPDRACPVEGDLLPDTAGMIGALEAVSGRPIDLVTGKPSLMMAQAAVEQLGLDFGSCYMVGDRLETDIKMGNEAGMKTVLVLTGVSTREMARTSPYRPDYIISSIRDLPDIG